MQPPGPVCDEWLSLEKASRILGVHPGTLRRWANGGAIAAFVTPGGHRRFRRSDLERFEGERRQAGGNRLPAQWTDQAIAHARQEMAGYEIAAAFDEGERQAQRILGRRLLGLVLQYAGAPREDSGLLAEASAIGESFADLSLNHQQPLVEMLRVLGLYKDALLEAAVVQPNSSGPHRPGDGGRLLLRIGRLLDEVQIGVVKRYESRSRS